MSYWLQAFSQLQKAKEGWIAKIASQRSSIRDGRDTKLKF